MTTRLQRRVCVLELFSGHGDVSRIATRVLTCSAATVDIEEEWEPSICMDITQWDSTHTNMLKTMHKGCVFIIWASPPCEEYSRAKTTGVRDIERADNCVRAVFRIKEQLQAPVLVVENPATGILAKRNNSLMDPVPFHHKVDYCQYGTLHRKETMLWSNIKLTDYGFVCRTCRGYDECMGMMKYKPTSRYRHIAHYDDLLKDYNLRIQVPGQLIASVFRAIENYMCEHPDLFVVPIAPKRTREEKKVINYVSATKEIKDQNDIIIRVHYRGQDASEWISFYSLDIEQRKKLRYNTDATRDRLKKLKELRKLRKKLAKLEKTQNNVANQEEASQD